MTGELWARLHELRKVLQLHFSDLGTVLDFQFEHKSIAIMEPMHLMVKFNPSESLATFMSHGDLITIQIKFKSKR